MSGWQLNLTLNTAFRLFKAKIGLKSGISSSGVETKIIPNQGIWFSAVNAGINGLSSGLIFGMVIGLGYELSYGLSYGLIFGLIFGLSGSGQACVQHFTLRLILYFNGYIP